MFCIMCKEENESVDLRSTIHDFQNNVTLTIQAPLCTKCVGETANKFKEVLANPILRSCLKVAGVGMGLFK